MKEHEGEGARCPHCGTAVEGTVEAYCCLGCEIAAAIIRDAGLERYYTERTEFPPRPVAGGGDWSAVPVDVDDDGKAEARLMVDGLRCASCVWVTERVLASTPGVESAVVSYATGRATLRWDPARVDLPALTRRIAALGYRPRPLGAEHRPDKGLMVRLAVAVFLGLDIMAIYEGLYAGWWYGAMDPRYAQLFRWTSLALSTPVAIWCAEPFFAGAWHGLRRGVLHMDLPVALGVAILYLHGVVATLAGRDAYLDSLGMLVALLLAGRVMESRSRRRATEAAAALVGVVPRRARRLVPPPDPANDTEPWHSESVPVQELRPGDRIDVGAGEELAADGRVLEGSGHVRMALVTGEATPVAVGPGDRVIAGTLLMDGALTVLVEAVGSATVVHRMAGEVEAAQDRALAPTSADRIAPWFTAATLVAAVATFVGWWLSRGTDVAVTRTIAVLVVACPCALALAQPLAAAAGLGAAARRGLLLRSGDALLRLGDVTEVGLDKTGTVTAGDIRVTEASDSTIRIAAGLERYSSHPIATAVMAEAGLRRIPLPRATGVEETPGVGVRGMVDGVQWELRAAGVGRVALSNGADRVATILLGDRTRPDARASVEWLRRLGLRTTLLTGDHPEIAMAIARQARVDDVRGRVDPAAKVAWIRKQQAQGARVLFAGDGLNDGPALAAADVGIAMAAGAASSVLVADGIISTDSLAPLAAGVRAGRAARRMTYRSQWQSLVYNLVSVGAAAAGLVNPLVAAVLMPASSALVIWNAGRVEHLMRQED